MPGEFDTAWCPGSGDSSRSGLINQIKYNKGQGIPLFKFGSSSQQIEVFMAELKTQRNNQSVDAFLDGIDDERKRHDSREILALMQRVTGEKPVMWGDSIIGFGSYRYKYASGRQAEWFLTGFSPRKQNLTLYIMSGFEDYEKLLDKLGKYKTGKSCLYINKMDDVDQGVLEKLVQASVVHMKERNETE